MRLTRKVILPLLLVGLSVAGASFFSPLAHAEAGSVSFDSSVITASATYDQIAKDAQAKADQTHDPKDIAAAQQAALDAQQHNAQAQTAAQSLAGNPGAANTGDSSCGVLHPLNCILDAVGIAILGFADFLLGIAGALFNMIMVYGVFQFANTIGNAPGVLTAWGILRDLANMALLFGFIFMGIATILDTGAVQSFTARNALPKLLIFAVLMNFSLFTAEAVIDVSNALTTTMYTQANTEPCLISGTDQAQARGCLIDYGIAGHIMQSTGLITIWRSKGNLDLHLTQYLGLALFATIGAIVFFAAAIMLAIRLIILTFLMILSPIGFAGMAIPPLQKFAGDWWSRVIHQAFYAPIMLLLILISLKVADSFTSSGNSALYGQLSGGLGNVATDPNTSTITIVLVFMLVIGFMVSSLVVANRFGAAGGAMAVNFGKKVVLGAYGGASGFVGRNTVGRAGAYTQKKYEAWAGNKENKVLAPLFRNDILGLHGVATSGFNTVKDAKFGGKKSFEEAQKDTEKRKGQLTHAFENTKQKEKLAAGIAGNDDKAVARILQEMNTNDIKQTDYVKKGADGIDMLARNLSPDKFEEMMKDKEIEADQKERLIKGRFAKLQEQIAKKDDSEVRKWSAKDLEQLAKFNGDVFEDLIVAEKANGDSLISTDQFDTLQKSNVLTNTQKQSVKENSIGGKIDSALKKGDTTKAMNLMNVIGGNKNKAKLSATILTNPTLAKNFSVPELLAIATEDKLSGPDRIKLANIVQSRKGEPEIGKLLNPDFNQAAAAYYTP